jgi:hypothetical protein
MSVGADAQKDSRCVQFAAAAWDMRIQFQIVTTATATETCAVNGKQGKTMEFALQSQFKLAFPKWEHSLLTITQLLHCRFCVTDVKLLMS